MNSMDELVDFLRAQLDDDERVASDAAGLAASRSHWTREAISCVVSPIDGGLIVYGEGTPTPEQAEHIARHDPARVLAEVDAKRRIIDSTAQFLDDRGGWRWFQGSESEAMAVIKLLALPYADREGWREEWRP